MALALSIMLFPVAVGAQSSGEAGASHAKTPDTSVATPRTADGHPDLTAIWSTGRSVADNLYATVSPDGKSRGVYIKNEIGVDDGKGLEDHVSNIVKRKLADREKETNYPPYKPELLAKVKNLEDHYPHFDPTFRCGPPGVPRLGPANQIIQSPGQVVFLYATNVGNFFRVIPTDGRAHRTDLDPSYMGDSVGHWEGDTLVVDVIGFNDDTWLAPERGYIHSEMMHVTERYTREGNTLRYEAIVDDPGVFTRAWKMNPRTVKVGTDPLPEADPCHDQDADHMPKGVYVY